MALAQHSRLSLRHPGVAAPSPAASTCPHFRLDEQCSATQAVPSAGNRCRVTKQEERVDLAHQERYCLTALHANCPWLLLPRDGRARGRRSWWRTARGLTTLVGAASFLALVALLVVAPYLGFDPVQRISLAIPAELGAPAPSVSPSSSDGSDPRLLPADALSASLLQGDSPSYMTISIPTSTGGAFVAGNVGFSFPVAALAKHAGPVSVSIERRPVSIPIPVAPWQVSSHGTIFQMMVKDGDGKQITTFPAPVTVLIKYSPTDTGLVDGNTNILTAGFIIDSRSPDLANPAHFPLGTWVFFPPSVTHFDAGEGTVSIQTQVAPTVLGVMSRPYSELKVVKETGLYSSFARTGKLFGVRGAASRLQVAGPPMRVAGPQIDSRLLILDPQTNNYAYVNVSDVSPITSPAAG